MHVKRTLQVISVVHIIFFFSHDYWLTMLSGIGQPTMAQYDGPQGSHHWRPFSGWMCIPFVGHWWLPAVVPMWQIYWLSSGPMWDGYLGLPKVFAAVNDCQSLHVSRLVSHYTQQASTLAWPPRFTARTPTLHQSPRPSGMLSWTRYSHMPNTQNGTGSRELELKIPYIEYWVLYKVKVAHTRLPSVGFRSWSRFLAVRLQLTWVINRR